MNMAALHTLIWELNILSLLFTGGHFGPRGRTSLHTAPHAAREGMRLLLRAFMCAGQLQ